MDLLFDIGNVIMGMFLAAIGFKVYNPFKNKGNKEEELLWYSKWGVFFKVLGVLLFLFGTFSAIKQF